VPLLAIKDGVPTLPTGVLDEVYLADLVERVLPKGATSKLLEAARAVGQHAHGAMLIISGDASGEAERLSPQSWPIEPTYISPSLLTQLTNMDGAVLLDERGRCHALGVILDGVASGKGDLARGSRLNSAVRYLDNKPPPTIVVAYSADGDVTILPRLRPRIARHVVNEIVDKYLDIATRSSNLEEVNRCWDAVKSVQFYLTAQQCDRLNEMRARQDELRESNIRIIYAELTPDPAMNDSYWL
jgi:hypothetical protein